MIKKHHTDQTTLDGSYIDRGIEEDCRSCKAHRSYSLCNRFQDSDKCKLKESPP